jgi:hypothetical protein
VRIKTPTKPSGFAVALRDLGGGSAKDLCDSSTGSRIARYDCGDVFGMLQRKLANLDRDFLDRKASQQVCCELVRQCLDKIDRLILNEPLRLFSHDCVVNRLADFIRHITRFPTWPERNVDRQALWSLSLMLRYTDDARNLKLLDVNFVRGGMRLVRHTRILTTNEDE